MNCTAPGKRPLRSLDASYSFSSSDICPRINSRTREVNGMSPCHVNPGVRLGIEMLAGIAGLERAVIHLAAET